MRLSRMFGKTLREIPAEAETISHRLLLRAGMIQQLTAGVYSLMPLALRAVQKIESIIRDEMNRAGSQELLMPALQPVELWGETGRDQAFGEILFHLKDRRGRELVLGPTHEEVITDLVRRFVRSYRDLPLILYQIQTKFRDEPRPRAGLVRVREFTMKDAYSFDVDEAGLDVSYEKMAQAYRNIFRRCGLSALGVQADSGAIGGKDSLEFMLIAETGENEIAHCTRCDYAANVEKAEFVKTRFAGEEPLPLERVSTPGIKTIDELARFLRVEPRQTLKAIFYMADREPIFVVTRGDLQVNEVKLGNALKAIDLRLATDEEVRRLGLVAGSASPIGLQGVKVVADESITLGSNFIAGGNEPNVHLRNVNYPRDFKVDLLIDVAKAEAGYLCVACGGALKTSRGHEVGHVFKLGLTYSTKMGATYLNRDGTQKPIYMGCYGIGSGRLLAAAIEQNHDDKGIVWPAAIAPYQVHLAALSLDQAGVADAAERLYRDLGERGYEVLYDDREETAGVKFNDADLLGMPVRLTVSPRTLGRGGVEIKRRTEKESRTMPFEEVWGELEGMLNGS